MSSAPRAEVAAPPRAPSPRAAAPSTTAASAAAAPSATSSSALRVGSAELAGVEQHIAAAAGGPGSSESAAAWAALANESRASKIACAAADQEAPGALNLTRLRHFDSEVRDFYLYCTHVATLRTPAREEAVKRIRRVARQLFEAPRTASELDAQARRDAEATAAQAAKEAAQSVGDLMIDLLSSGATASDEERATTKSDAQARETEESMTAELIASRDHFVFEFGSSATTMALPSSDVDLVIRPPLDEASAPHLYDIRLFANALRDEGWLASIHCIDTATVPVLKLVAPCKTKEGEAAIGGDLKLDISMWRANHLGHSTLQLVLQLAHTWRPLAALMVVLKQLLAEHGLSNPGTGGLASYGLLLMVVRFLQVYQTRRTKRDYRAIAHTSLGHLLLEFFKMYSPAVFNPRVTGIRIDEIEEGRPELWEGAFVPRYDPEHESLRADKEFAALVAAETAAHAVEKAKAKAEGRKCKKRKKPRRLPKRNRTFPFTQFDHDPLLIVDPLNEVSNNVGRSCYRINLMQRVFGRAHERLAAVLSRRVGSDGVGSGGGEDDNSAPVGAEGIAVGARHPTTVLGNVIAVAESAVAEGGKVGAEGARASVRNALRYARRGHDRTRAMPPGSLHT